MNIKLKMTLIIIVTLAFGIAIGAMVNRTLSQNRIRRVLSRRDPPVFISFYEEIIEPDANQREEIKKILNKHAKHLSEIHANFSEELQSSMETLKAELDPILTPEQKKRLERGLPLRGRPPFTPPFPIERNLDEELSALKKELGLTEDQTSQVKHILEEWINKARVMRRDREPFRNLEQFIQSEKEKEKAIEKILKKDQKKLYEQMKKERFKKMEEEMRKRRERMKRQGFPRF